MEVSTFKVIDSLIATLNDNPENKVGFKIIAKYATPSDYFNAID